MEPELETGLSRAVAVIVCLAMAFFYVAILYAPTFILRLPPPPSVKDFMIRRFICAAISSIVSILCCALILPIRSWEATHILGVFGIQLDHIWQAVVLPLSLTSLMYAGTLVLKSLVSVDLCKELVSEGGGFSIDCVKHILRNFIDSMSATASDVMAWRNYIVAPLTEELVFRACMIPLLLCGGFKIYSVIFLCPILFSLAHLNHWMEIYTRHNYSFLKASTVVGLQLGYTVIFGSYASFLYIRTGHLLAPIVAHMVCNSMGLPVLFSRSKGLVSLAFLVGVAAFVLLLFPITQPNLYNDRTTNCSCWHGYCSWN
ncbi:CAAX prenyl protease 2 [Euphorbia peplus]|nr:CAAX prenyl protease 2 [Euphorbia peplus]